MDTEKMCDQKKYVNWTVGLVLRNKERAREVYHLLVGFLSGADCRKENMEDELSRTGNDLKCVNHISDNAMLYKISILELLDAVAENEREIVFLRQIYTIMKKHIEKENGCNEYLCTDSI